jgi:uroporphyrinogen-III decarboxylase
MAENRTRHGEEGADFATHNEDTRQLWRDFDAGTPARVPVVFNFSRRFYLLSPWLNAQGYTFQQYFDDPAVQWEVQLALQKWVRECVPQDQERGLPETWAGLAADFQNLYEAAWLGCRIEYREAEVPDTWPCLKERKGDLATMRVPDPLHGGIQGRALEYYEYFEERRKRDEYAGPPVGASALSGGGTDGPFTVACNLRGATEMCLDLYEDPAYARELLDFVTESIITRVRAVGQFNKVEYPQQGWGFADDSIQLLSEATYREFVMPCHQRLLAEFSKGGPNSIHLCGNVQRFLPLLQHELNIQTFDLGFPVDLGQVRRDLGPEAMLRGNLHPQILRDGPVSLIREQTARILRSGVMDGRKYVFCEGNNVAPQTPIEHFQAAYETARAVGVY